MISLGQNIACLPIVQAAREWLGWILLREAENTWLAKEIFSPRGIRLKKSEYDWPISRILQDALPRDDAVHSVSGDERLRVQCAHLAAPGHKIFCEVKW